MREDTCRLPDQGKPSMHHIVHDLNRPGCRVSHCGLTLEDTLEETAWRDIGKALGRIVSSQQWWIGDWWAFGQHRYGARSALVDAEDWQGPALQSCMNAASVSRRIETSRRREVLSFAHHEVVAALAPSEADALLDWAVEGLTETGKVRSIRALREERGRRQREKPVVGRAVRVNVTRATAAPRPVTISILSEPSLSRSEPGSARSTDAISLRSFRHVLSGIADGDDAADLVQLVTLGLERHYLELAKAAQSRLTAFIEALRSRGVFSEGTGGADEAMRH